MKVENGAAFVQIINAEYLTQRMGSSGAQDYLAPQPIHLQKIDRLKSKLHF
jgi:hypothetical protein